MAKPNKSVTCSNCGVQITKRLTKLCPQCGNLGKTHKLLVQESISVADSFKWENIREYFEHHPIILPFVFIVTIASPLLGLFIAGWTGVIVGVLIGVTTFWLGLKAITKMREIRVGNYRYFMKLPPLLDPSKLFFFIDPNEDLLPEDLNKLEELFSIPGNVAARVDNIHFVLCLLHDCVSIDFERYINEVILPWSGLKQRTKINRERILTEFYLLSQFEHNSKELMAHLVQIYRGIVSDLFDPYITLIVASYQFKEGNFSNIDNANLGQGERNKVEFILARKECEKLLSGYDGRVRNAISHSGSHGITYNKDSVDFREISRSATNRVKKINWSVEKLEQQIVDLFESILSIDAVEAVFAADCRYKINSNMQTKLMALYYHTDLNERKQMSVSIEEKVAMVVDDISLTAEIKLSKLLPTFTFNCTERKMPVTSISINPDLKLITIFIPTKGDISSDESLIQRATEMTRYGILAQTCFRNLAENYKVIEQNSNLEPIRITVQMTSQILQDYCDERAGIIDLLNDSLFTENDKNISLQCDFEALENAEMSSLNEPFPRYNRV